MGIIDGRDEVTKLHAELREAMRRALGIATAVLRGSSRDGLAGESLGESLREAAADLVFLARRHAELERERLEPELERLDAWGAVRCARLHELHELQRRAVAGPDGAGHYALAAPTELASAVRRAVTELLRALRWEERELQRVAPVAADDIVNTDQFGG